MAETIEDFQKEFTSLRNRHERLVAEKPAALAEEHAQLAKRLAGTVMDSIARLGMQTKETRGCIRLGVCELAVWGNPDDTLKAMKAANNVDLTYTATACAVGNVETSPGTIQKVLNSGLLPRAHMEKIGLRARQIEHAERTKGYGQPAKRQEVVRIIDDVLARTAAPNPGSAAALRAACPAPRPDHSTHRR